VSSGAPDLVFCTNDSASAIVADIVDLYFRIEVYTGKSPFIRGMIVTLHR
jgi:hypothetical protein